MALTDLENVEKEFGVTIARRRPMEGRKDDAYYLQFDEAIRKEAGQMARSYEVFYCLEKAIRSLIRGRLEESAPKEWWLKLVPPATQDEVKKRMQRETDAGITPRSDEPLDFTTFGELGDIIGANWSVFGDMFTSRKAVEKIMTSLNNLRGPIAHCSPLAPDEVVRLGLTVRDWFRLME